MTPFHAPLPAASRASLRCCVPPPECSWPHLCKVGGPSAASQLPRCWLLSLLCAGLTRVCTTNYQIGHSTAEKIGLWKKYSLNFRNTNESAIRSHDPLPSLFQNLHIDWSEIKYLHMIRASHRQGFYVGVYLPLLFTSSFFPTKAFIAAAPLSDMATVIYALFAILTWS